MKLLKIPIKLSNIILLIPVVAFIVLLSYLLIKAPSTTNPTNYAGFIELLDTKGNVKTKLRVTFYKLSDSKEDAYTTFIYYENLGFDYLINKPCEETKPYSQYWNYYDYYLQKLQIPRPLTYRDEINNYQIIGYNNSKPKSDFTNRIAYIKRLSNCNYLDKAYVKSFAKKSNFKPGNLNIPRKNFEAFKINNRKILIIGGISEKGTLLKSIEIYDPLLGTVKEVAQLNYPRMDTKSTLLPNGNVLINFGLKCDDNQIAECFYKDSETFITSKNRVSSKVSGEFEPLNEMLTPSFKFDTVNLKDGKVLFVGTMLAIYDTDTNMFFMSRDNLDGGHFLSKNEQYIKEMLGYRFTLLKNGDILLYKPGLSSLEYAYLVTVEKLK